MDEADAVLDSLMSHSVLVLYLGVRNMNYVAIMQAKHTQMNATYDEVCSSLHDDVSAIPGVSTSQQWELNHLDPRERYMYAIYDVSKQLTYF